MSSEPDMNEVLHMLFPNSVKSSVESLKKAWYILDIHIPKAILKRSKGKVLLIQGSSGHH
jgi:hypothetical protein